MNVGYNPDDNEIITVSEVYMYFRESGGNPEQFRCCIQGGDIHYATGRSIYSYSGKADIAYDL